jgi:hypothetical protein
MGSFKAPVGVRDVSSVFKSFLPNTLQLHFFAAAVADPIVMFPMDFSSDCMLDVSDLVNVSIVLRRRGLSPPREVVELPRELRGPDKELLSKRADDELRMT